MIKDSSLKKSTLDYDLNILLWLVWLTIFPHYMVLFDNGSELS